MEDGGSDETDVASVASLASAGTPGAPRVAVSGDTAALDAALETVVAGAPLEPPPLRARAAVRIAGITGSGIEITTAKDRVRFSTARRLDAPEAEVPGRQEVLRHVTPASYSQSVSTTDGKEPAVGSNFKFKFDERCFKKAVEKAANEAVKDAAKNVQRVLDDVHRSHAGRAVSEILTRLRSAARSAGWKFTDAELLPYAEAISEGTRVVVQPGKARL